MTRDTITNNEVGHIPTLPIFVGFTINNQEVPFPANAIPAFLEKIFGDTNSMNAYYKEISYTTGPVGPHNLVLAQENELSVVVRESPSYYRWGYVPGEFESAKPKELTRDVFTQVLEINPTFAVQDKFVILILNATTQEIEGRGAMCLVPGITVQPQDALPENQELFIGASPLENPQPGAPREPYFIDMEYKWPQYLRSRRNEFNNWNDQFIRGLCIFCKDTLLSCAVHDGIHALKRISSGIPTLSFPGTRGRAVPCLYNLYIQGVWLENQCNRGVYCTPYVGWWDNTGDHLHLRPPRQFFSGSPYGVSAFTKLKLDVIPDDYIGEATGSDMPFKLYKLATRHLPPQTNGQPVLVVKVPLSEGATPTEYLLVEYRRWVSGGADGVTVDIARILGDPATDPEEVNPPEYLASDKGILIYHVNEERPHLGSETTDWCTTDQSGFVQDFIMYLYTPSMVTSGGLDWSSRTPEALKSAGFDIGSTFTLEYPPVNPHLRVEIHISEWDDDVADIEVRRISI
ncbi:MAG: hypothetical protein HXS46_20675 [Theionarchaea archaeon]|nr:MAG: hypothetical protein AYK18_08900 [Theionarchaea archaeon DG-70]MBU7013103.1 hypothetical protein [Theionarchaea archaeon]